MITTVTIVQQASGRYKLMQSADTPVVKVAGVTAISTSLDISGLVEKSDPHADDKFLIEDSQAAEQKKYIKFKNIGDGGTF